MQVFYQVLDDKLVHGEKKARVSANVGHVKLLDQPPVYCLHCETRAGGESKVPSYKAKGSLPLENHSSVARQERGG